MILHDSMSLLIQKLKTIQLELKVFITRSRCNMEFTHVPILNGQSGTLHDL